MLVNYLKLNAAIAECGMTQKSLCHRINMAESTFIRKKKDNSFTLREAEAIALVLHKKPGDIFFASVGT